MNRRQFIHGATGFVAAASFEGAGAQAPQPPAVKTVRAGVLEIGYHESGDPEAPFSAYLVFVRWAQTGTAVMGHLETDDVLSAASEDEARAAAEALTLARAREILDETIRRRAAGAADA